MEKAKGKEKLDASDVPPEVEEATGDDTNAESTQSEPANIEEETTTVVLDKSEGDTREEINNDDKVKSVTTDVIPEGEKVEDGDNKEKAKDDVEVESVSNKKARGKGKRKKAAASAVTSDDGKQPNDGDKPGNSAAEKKDLKADGMGLIFMCNSKTKKDCYNYKVLGLPASKKEIVAKVYKGMRLFLFDVDLKLMYGIYKAASPGGYNIVPKAFKSAFPSQVHFTVLEDCLPLPEEKFKAAIKANYYGKNKFSCQLSPEQVKNLCKLFRSAGKTSKKRHPGEASRAEQVPQDRRWRRERVRRRPAIGDRDNIIPSGADLYAREAYRSPQMLVVHPAPLPPPSYAYDRAVDDYYYRRDLLPPPLPLELRDHRIRDVEIRLREPIEYRDPYSLYREPLPYREPLYPATASLTAAYAPSPPLYYRY